MALDRQHAAMIALLAAAAGVSLWLLRRQLKRRDSQYEDLDGIVSFSSRFVAAMRAMESEEDGRIYSDPLAGVLAGSTAMMQVRGMLEGTTSKEGNGAPKQPPEAAEALQKLRRKHPVRDIALRTWWYDNELQQALQRADGASGSGKARKQVVVLGAGMDTRAWRHAWLQGVTWVEVDRRDVLAAKGRALPRASAQPTAESVGGWRYPLLADRRVTLEADLNHAGWTGKLTAAGWDRQLPTVWLAEGLLMYIDPPAVEALLREAAKASVKGSSFLAQAVTTPSEADATAMSRNKTSASLLDSFVWFCAPDPRPLFKRQGWASVDVATYASIAKSSGKPQELFAPEMLRDSGFASVSRFIVATL